MTRRKAGRILRWKFWGSRPHLKRLRAAIAEESPKSWNKWRKSNPTIRPDLRGLQLHSLGEGVNLAEFDLTAARLAGARLTGMRAWDCRLQSADLRRANLDDSDLSYALLNGANLESCRLVGANLTLVDAAGANFRHANLSHAVMNGAWLHGADLSGAIVSGLSAWDVQVDAETGQEGLRLEELGDFLEDLVDVYEQGTKKQIGRVNSIEAIQIIYLLKDKAKFRTVIDALTDKVVLILGNFSRSRLAVLREIERVLAGLGYIPVIFDFEAPVDRDLIESVALLAGLSCFVIADLTKPASMPLEAMLVVPQIRVPFATIIEEDNNPFSMFLALQAKYEWVLPTHTYSNVRTLTRQLKSLVVDPCEAMRRKLRRARRVAKQSNTRTGR